ncbi:nitroreductase family protein [Salidesulfovibrio onnuriiensis]|uniref:nitroreductase family protein n=1 Tax=Salidesulfovibrio onnuriiensis TaxID=2583823 RepID=UPI0011CA0F40|nr:nitroreductase family protein [Salidesulfovibrio onnuriiensis]
MLNFMVDTEKCTQCGECARDCVFGVITMDGFPSINAERAGMCCRCQHCLAVCKPGAISILGKNPADSVPLSRNLPAPEQMEALILGRRSIRRYKKENVDPKLIRHLLELTTHAPTAVNQQLTRLTVVDNREAMDRLRERTAEAADKAIREGRIPQGMERIASFIQGGGDGEDVIFRNAPHLLVASAPKDALAPAADCHIALSYFELLANSHGIGTVWDGIARSVMDVIAPEIRELLGIPADHLVVAAMVFGKPAVKYHRSVQHSTDNIHRASL